MHSSSTTRLTRTGTWLLYLLLLPACSVHASAQTIEVTQLTTLPQAEGAYRAWPTIARLDDGRLLAVYSGNRQGHIGPYGRVEMIISEDEGETWSEPVEVLDTQTDDRDGGVVQTPSGKVLVTTFTSNAWLNHLDTVMSEWDEAEGVHRSWHTSPINRAKLDDWQRMRDNVPQRFRGNVQGWIVRYEDLRRRWTHLIASPVHTPNGPLVLNNGTLLFLGRTTAAMEAHRSTDDGLTWQYAGEVEPRPGDRVRDYHEADAAQLSSGRIVAHIRNHNERNQYEILQTVSDDQAITWSVPEATGIWGYPADLLHLGGDRMLTTYGKRKQPLTIAARVSNDGGATWSDELVLATDLAHADMGYPTTVRLSDGSFATLWYQVSADDRYESTLGFAKWTLTE